MRKIPKTQTATSFRSNLYKTLANAAKGETFLISQKKGQDVIVMGRDQLNALLEERDVLRSIGIGVSQLESGKVVSHKKAIAELNRIKNKWK